MIDNTQIGSKPNIEYFKLADVDMVKIPYEIEEVSPGVYTWREISVRRSNYNYGGIVSELIGLAYSDTKMIAIINNYLLDPTDEEAKTEFGEMQNYRKYAKSIAKELFSL